MKTTLRFWAAMAVSAGLLASCADIKEINDRLDEFDGRLTALETVTTNLNNNIETMQALYSGATINSATNDNGTWTIVLSNGETLTLTQGSIGVGNAPVMSVDKDGYWMVDYDGKDGQAPEYIMNGENKVLATGTDGKTPIFGVDASGYWTVKYDAAATPEQVLGADGQPVKALPEGGVQDPYFADVKMENGEFKVTLRSGEQLVIPVISDFLCAIECTGVQTFNAGETKPYNVTIKGVKSTMITTPAGWTAVLSEPVGQSATLTVTAPVTTKAALADTRSDISILAFSAQGLATIAKMSVNCSDTPVVANPVASVTAGEATETTLAYSIVVSDVTSWKYIHQKSSEAAPDAAKIAADGIAGSQTSLVFENLDPSTEYTLYVLPVNADKQGTVASIKNTTLKQTIASYHALYNDGETITIDGISINKETYPDATFLETDSEITTNGVYFLKEGITAKYTGTGAIKSLIVIGDKEGARSTFKMDAVQIKLNPGTDKTGICLFNNIIFDHSTASQYAMNVNFVGNFGTIIFNDCEIKQCANKNLLYNFDKNNLTARGIEQLSFIGCDINITSTQAFVGCSTSQAEYGTYKVDNCIFYGDGSKAFSLHGGSATKLRKVIFTRNTFCNVLATNNVWFNCGTITEVTINGNILYMDSQKSIADNQSIVHSASAIITSGTIGNNICYTGQEKTFQAIYGGSEKWFEGVNEITKLGVDPFTGGTFDLANGKFTPAADYLSYGAKR